MGVPEAFKKWSELPKQLDAPPPPPPPMPPGLLATLPMLLKASKLKYNIVNKALSAAPIIMELAHLTKLPHVHVLTSIIGLIVYIALVCANVYASFLTYILAVAWPIFRSLRAAASLDKNEVQAWLSYWVINAILTLIEYTGSGLLSLLPFYYFFKMVFVLWLIVPYFNGSLIIYTVVLKNILPPIIKPPEPKKDELKKWAYSK